MNSSNTKRLGFEDGLPDDLDAQRALWNNAHTAALEDYGMAERVKDPLTGKLRSTLYHPSCDELSLPENWKPPPGWPLE